MRWVNKEEMLDLIQQNQEELSPWLRKIWTQFLEPNWLRWIENKFIEDKYIMKGVIPLE